MRIWIFSNPLFLFLHIRSPKKHRFGASLQRLINSFHTYPDFELSHNNPVNRIVKITHAHNLHVKMLNFALLQIECERTQIVYEINLLKRF